MLQLSLNSIPKLSTLQLRQRYLGTTKTGLPIYAHHHFKGADKKGWQQSLLDSSNTSIVSLSTDFDHGEYPRETIYVKGGSVNFLTPKTAQIIAHAKLLKIAGQDMLMAGKDLMMHAGSEMGAMDKVLGSITLESNGKVLVQTQASNTSTSAMMLRTGDSFGANEVTGNIDIVAGGVHAAASTAGNVTLAGGSAAKASEAAAAGSVNLAGGDGSDKSAGGQIVMESGKGLRSGNVTIASGQAVARSGDLLLRSASMGSASSGSITLNTGSSAQPGNITLTSGDIILTGLSRAKQHKQALGGGHIKIKATDSLGHPQVTPGSISLKSGSSSSNLESTVFLASGSSSTHEATAFNLRGTLSSWIAGDAREATGAAGAGEGGGIYLEGGGSVGNHSRGASISINGGRAEKRVNGLRATGGALRLFSGKGLGLVGSSGPVHLKSPVALGRSGDILLETGAATNLPSGSATLQTGDVSSAHEVGRANILGGNGHSARGGDIDIVAGSSMNAAGGAITITSGGSQSKSAGDITVTAGSGKAKGTEGMAVAGTIRLSSGSTMMKIGEDGAKLDVGPSTLNVGDGMVRIARKDASFTLEKAALEMVVHGQSRLDMNLANLTLEASKIIHRCKSAIVSADNVEMDASDFLVASRSGPAWITRSKKGDKVSQQKMPPNASLVVANNQDDASALVVAGNEAAALSLQTSSPQVAHADISLGKDGGLRLGCARKNVIKIFPGQGGGVGVGQGAAAMNAGSEKPMPTLFVMPQYARANAVFAKLPKISKEVSFLAHSAEENVVQISGGDKGRHVSSLVFSSMSASSGAPPPSQWIISHGGPQDTQRTPHSLSIAHAGEKETFLQDGKLESRTKLPPPALIITPDGAVGLNVSKPAKGSRLTVQGAICTQAIHVETPTLVDVQGVPKPVKGALALVSKLRGVEVLSKGDSSLSYAMLAHEVSARIPGIMRAGQKGNKKAIDAFGLSVLLVEAIKELRAGHSPAKRSGSMQSGPADAGCSCEADIASLEAETAQLKGEIAALSKLKTEMQQLRGKVDKLLEKQDQHAQQKARSMQAKQPPLEEKVVKNANKVNQPNQAVEAAPSDQAIFLDIMSKRRAVFWTSQESKGMHRNKIMDEWRNVAGEERAAALQELQEMRMDRTFFLSGLP